MDKFIPNQSVETVAIRALFEPTSKDFTQLSGRGLWYTSINFGYEINLKVLMYSAFLDLKV